MPHTICSIDSERFQTPFFSREGSPIEMVVETTQHERGEKAKCYQSVIYFIDADGNECVPHHDSENILNRLPKMNNEHIRCVCGDYDGERTNRIVCTYAQNEHFVKYITTLLEFVRKTYGPGIKT